MKASLQALGPVATTVGAVRYLKRYWGPQPCAIFPANAKPNPVKGSADYIYAMDPRMIALRNDLREWFDKNHPVDYDDSGYAGPSGIAANASALTAMSGVPMMPTPIPISNNAKFLASLKIDEMLPTRSLPILDELMRLFSGR